MKAPHEALTAEQVATLLGYASESEDSELAEYTACNPRSFAEEGVLTNNAGFVIRLQDGSEFQVTVVQSCPTHSDYLPDDGTLDEADMIDAEGPWGRNE